MTKVIIPSDLANFLRYDPGTGRFFWTAVERPQTRYLVGREAGTSRNTGYVTIMFRKVRYQAAHLAYFLMTGIAPIEIDHADGDPSNNRWVNLRMATRTENTCNRRGWGKYPKGVAKANKSDRFVSTINYRRVFHYLGTFDTVDDAHAAYVAAAERLHGEFARPK